MSVSTEDFVSALKAMQAMQVQPAPPAPPAEPTGIAKHATAVVVALVIGLMLWAGSTLLMVSNKLESLSAASANLTKTMDEIKQDRSASTKALADLQAGQARGDARADATTADINRIKERLRIVEGQPPLRSTDDGR